MEILSQSRRKFITTLTLLLASGGLLVRYLIPRSSAQRRILARASRADIPAGGALVFRQERVALMKDSSGFYAMSLVCTHLGCTVTITPEVISCPCHGSRFDRQGKVLTGPAERALERMDVELRGDEVLVLG